MMNETTKSICLGALDKLSEANVAMIKALETVVKELTDNGKNIIRLKTDLIDTDYGSVNYLKYDSREENVYAVAEWGEISLDDLTADNYYSLIKCLMIGNYEMREDPDYVEVDEKLIPLVKSLTDTVKQVTDTGIQIIKLNDEMTCECCVAVTHVGYDTDENEGVYVYSPYGGFFILEDLYGSELQTLSDILTKGEYELVKTIK